MTLQQHWMEIVGTRHGVSVFLNIGNYSLKGGVNSLNA